MYNPMIMQASCTMYSLVAFCKGENESDLQPVIFPVSSPLLSEDNDLDLLMVIRTLVDITQLLVTTEKAIKSAVSNNEYGTTSAVADATNASQQSTIVGPPLLMSCKLSSQTSLRSLSKFAFNHVLASYIQAQLMHRLTMPVVDEPVPPEARLPISSLGGVVSLFDLPLIRPLIAKSSLKSATEPTAASSKTDTQLTSTSTLPVAATGDGILGRPPAPIFCAATGDGILGRPPEPIFRFQAPHNAPAARPLAGRNFAGPVNWHRPSGGIRPAVMHEPRQWTGSSKIHGASWQWNSGTAGNDYERPHWDSGHEPVDSDWNSYSGRPSMTPLQASRNPVGVRQRPLFRPPVGQSAFPHARQAPPQVC